MYPSWVMPFLEQLTATGNVSASARAAGISSGAVYAKRREDADFAAAWEQALEDHTDTCEQELTRRAFGYDEVVVHQGQPSPVWERDEQGQMRMQVVEATNPLTGEIQRRLEPIQARNEDGSLQWFTQRKFSDTLLLARVKAYRKRYSTDRTELTGAGGGALSIDESSRVARVAQLMSIANARAEAGTDDFTDLA